MIEPITMIVTSCGRFDLLKKTLDSFFKLNKYPIKYLYIHEDSLTDKFTIDNYNNGNLTILQFEKKQGLSQALDNLMYLVDNDNNEYYFSTEDDFLYSGNSNFIEQSLTILKNNPDINQVWIRDSRDHSHPLGKPYELNGVMVQDVLKGYQGHWGGFSFNPGVKRLSDYKKYFPNGYSEFGDEALCSKHVESIGYKAVSLVEHAITHIGYGRHTDNFKV